jgi:ABC-2 type transport system ATP-binding protein
VALRDAVGTTVFLTTHYLDEADQLAERVMVMDHGVVIADDTPAALKSRLAGDRITITFESAADAHSALRHTGGEASGAVVTLPAEAAAAGARAVPGLVQAFRPRPSATVNPPSTTCSSP